MLISHHDTSTHLKVWAPRNCRVLRRNLFRRERQFGRRQQDRHQLRIRQATVAQMEEAMRYTGRQRGYPQWRPAASLRARQIQVGRLDGPNHIKRQLETFSHNIDTFSRFPFPDFSFQLIMVLYSPSILNIFWFSFY